jgi:hypothetical protein
MRLASFNLENIFDRAKALNQDTMAEGKVILDEFARLNKLFGQAAYSPSDKEAILKGLKDLGVLKDDNAGEFVRLRQNRGKLLKRPQSGPVQVVANGRDDWIGLGKLYRRTGKREQAQEDLATAMTMYREMGMTYWLEKAEAELKD